MVLDSVAAAHDCRVAWSEQVAGAGTGLEGEMAKLAIVATIEVAPDRREEVVSHLMAHRARCLRDEPGTLQFEVLVPNEDANKVLLYELYRDAAAFDEHWNGASIARFREERSGIDIKLSGTRCSLRE